MLAKELKISTLPDTTMDRGDIVWINVRQEPFAFYGLYNPMTEPVFRRVPAEVAEATSEAVQMLSCHTTGGKIRFSTNSPYIAIRAERPAFSPMCNMTYVGQSGFDLYRDTEAGSYYYDSFVPSSNPVSVMESRIFPNRVNDLDERFDIYTEMNDYTLNLSLYAPLNNLYIGLRADSKIGPGREYKYKKPIVFYGSSITHGCSASRPGVCYPNTVSRMLDSNIINLGFSGAAKGEKAIRDYICGLDMSVFVLDYDYNAPTAKHLRETHLPFYLEFREKHPGTPCIMVTRPSFKPDTDNDERRSIVWDTYNYAKDHGDRLVSFVDGQRFFLDSFGGDCTIDTVHPNDLGFHYMAETIGAEIRKYLYNI